VAQTRRRRRRKHRGTQGGGIDRRGRTSRPRSRQEARARTRKQLGAKKPGDGPPTWRRAVGRGSFAAALFLVLLVVLFHQSLVSSVSVAVLMLAFYIPMGYMIDRFVYNRRLAAARRERERRARGE
jgi:Flp pilus assembly protein TadB